MGRPNVSLLRFMGALCALAALLLANHVLGVHAAPTSGQTVASPVGTMPPPPTAPPDATGTVVATAVATGTTAATAVATSTAVATAATTGTPAATTVTTGTPAATTVTTGTPAATTVATGTAVATTAPAATDTAVATATTAPTALGALPVLVARTAMHRSSGHTVTVSWRMAYNLGIKGFRIYAGKTLASRGTIPAHHSATYTARVHLFTGRKYALVVLLKHGASRRVPLHFS